MSVEIRVAPSSVAKIAEIAQLAQQTGNLSEEVCLQLQVKGGARDGAEIEHVVAEGTNVRLCGSAYLLVDEDSDMQFGVSLSTKIMPPLLTDLGSALARTSGVGAA